jgi:hypothetical protein
VTKEALEALISRLEIRAVIFGVIVGIGVAGEAVYGFRIWWNNRKLRRLQDEENLALQLKVSEFQQKAESFRLDIARANERAAEAQLALEKFKAWRTINADDQKQMVKSLRAFKGTPFSLSTAGQPEPISLVQLVRSILRQAEWTQLPAPWGTNFLGDSMPSISVNVETHSGIILFVNPSRLHDWGAAAGILKQLLEKQGFDTRESNPTEGIDAKPDAIHISIGTK